MKTVLRNTSLAITLALGLGASVMAADSSQKGYVYVPDTVSPQAQALLAKKGDPTLTPTLPAADDIQAWSQLQAVMAQATIAANQAFVDGLHVSVSEQQLGGVPVLDIRPQGWQDDGKVMVYTHGGAYTLQSAESTLGSSGLMASHTRLRVISIDYTLAPHSQWQQTTDEVVSVFKALLAEGYTMDDIAIYGDSAGGGLAAGSVLKLRELGLGMPAAVVLWSPWSDITDSGDSYQTLKHAEPAYLYELHLKPSADAYAAPEDQKHPYVSPVYGDYSQGFPPTLIQGGTKEIFLSNFIRHYQVLDQAGVEVKLDLYDAMPHVFQPQMAMAGAPEAEVAMDKVDAFVKRHLMD